MLSYNSREARTGCSFPERTKREHEEKKQREEGTAMSNQDGSAITMMCGLDVGNGYVKGRTKVVGKPTFDVESGSVLTVSGRYRNGTRQTAELDKGSIVSVGVPK